MENKILVFDMDGTIVDLYGVEDWLPMLRREDTTPYRIANPMWDMILLRDILLQLKDEGWKIVVTTWTAKNGSPTYNKATAEAKKEWLYKFEFPFDEFHGVRYGTTKKNCTRKYGGRQILIDDNAKVRKGWKGETVNPETVDIIAYLYTLLEW